MKTTISYIMICVLAIALSCLSASAEEGEKSAEKTLPVITNGKSVKVHYILKVDGEVIDRSSEGKPLTFQVGNRQLIPGFEKAVMGMKTGEKKSFKISPEEGYGLENPEGIKEIPKEQLPPDIKPEAGMMLSARGSNGQTFPVRIIEVKKDVVVMNFNHPLAGKILNFNVEIIEIK